MIGATNPLEAATGSIRGDFAIAVGQNMVHGSDSPESGQREAALFFPEPLVLRQRVAAAARDPRRRSASPSTSGPRASRR